MRGDNPAEFESFEEARGAADTHVRDAYPNSPSIEDGLAWVSDPGISTSLPPVQLTSSNVLPAMPLV